MHPTQYGGTGSNPGWHCIKVSEGCKNCYAEKINQRLGTGLPYTVGAGGEVEIFMDEKLLRAPMNWRKPRRIFVGSITDLFGEFVSDELIDRVLVMIMFCPKHTFQILTKRPERMNHYIQSHTGKKGEKYYGLLTTVGSKKLPVHPPGSDNRWPLSNLWLGVSVENQETADERIPLLLQTPAARRFVSYEPALGPVNFEELGINTPGHNHKGELDWVICGGESGPGARPMHPDWARQARDQCVGAGIPFFFKQWGEWIPFGQQAHGPLTNDQVMRCRKLKLDGEPFVRNDETVYRVGKKRAGRLLDRREWNEMPDAVPVAP